MSSSFKFYIINSLVVEHHQLLEPVKGVRHICEEYLAYCVIYWLIVFLGLKPGTFDNVSLHK